MKPLKKEVDRMKELAGIIKENDEVEPQDYEEFERLKNYDLNRLGTDFSITLKVEDSTKNRLIGLEIPKESGDNEMTKLPNDKLHTTLTSIRGFKPFKEDFKDFTLPKNLNIPDAILGEGKFVYRDEQGKVTYVFPLENQNEFKEFVDKIYESLDLENPEPDRFFHITVANNAGGNSFKSIGNVTKKDFK
tara:strand:+ start:10883 stop:11452 length:570 start_codon:yes stop_codon:yes gene_type:complete